MEKQYDHKKNEAAMQQLWHDQKTYKTVPDKPLYSIDTPPPTVSGALHIGHIFSYTQTDIFARYKRMNEFSVFYPFGFDDNGLATERFVEKKCDVSAHSMKRSEFIELCLKETHDTEQQFKKLWQQMGLSVDWSACYSTIAPSTRKISQQSFIELYKKGFIYKNEPALYCTTCRTTVAQAELDDLEKPGLFNTIAFKLDDGIQLLIGTTRPELLPSCVALFYNPNDPRYQQLQGKQAIVPLFNYTVPILADEQVVIEKGTGLVMCCTFGDKTDIAWIKKFNLPYKPSIGRDGRWNENTGFLVGLKVQQAREAVLAELAKQGLLLEQKQIMHSVNVHERCKKEIEYLSLNQWFLKILPYKKEFLALADQLEWFPTFMKSRYTNWVEALSWDWCLSRQRFYGIPFPAWHCNNGHVIIAKPEMLPVDPQETAYHGTCPECGTAIIEPDTDIMDTWNTSSLTPQICFSLFNPSADPFHGAPVHEFIPMSMRPQAHDIIRTWAFYTIVKSWMHYGTFPWKSIVISGHVLSDAKEKLSKSKENTRIAPETLLQNYSADVIRYWTASGRLGQDVAFSETQLKIGQRLVTKLWNAFRFIQEHMPATVTTQPDNLGALNEWLLHQSSSCYAQYKKHFEHAEFSLALDAIEQFFWHDFCDNYLELIKEQLFKPELYSDSNVHATRWTLYTVGFQILQVYAPYLPHITELLYQELYRNSQKTSSLHITTFDQRYFVFEHSTTTIQHLITLITHVRSLKTEHQLSLKTPLETLDIYRTNQKVVKELEQLNQIIKGVTHALTVRYHINTGMTSSLRNENSLWHAKIVIDPSLK